MQLGLIHSNQQQNQILTEQRKQTQNNCYNMKYQFQQHQTPINYHEQQQQQHVEQMEHMQLHHNHYNNYQQHYLTIEDIKMARNSCWLCGCNWLEEQISLDCPECGGYALSRPCPNCDGKCQQTWTRNISATHDRHRALWVGQCKFQTATTTTMNNKHINTQTLSDADRFMAAAQAAASIISSNKQSPIFSSANTTMATTTTSNNSNVQGLVSNTSSPYQQHLIKSGSASQVVGMLVAPSSSSCCSSQPSSAATSDEETDDLLSK